MSIFLGCSSYPLTLMDVPHRLHRFILKSAILAYTSCVLTYTFCFLTALSYASFVLFHTAAG